MIAEGRAFEVIFLIDRFKIFSIRLSFCPLSLKISRLWSCIVTWVLHLIFYCFTLKLHWCLFLWWDDFPHFIDPYLIYQTSSLKHYFEIPLVVLYHTFIWFMYQFLDQIHLIDLTYLGIESLIILHVGRICLKFLVPRYKRGYGYFKEINKKEGYGQGGIEKYKPQKSDQCS